VKPDRGGAVLALLGFAALRIWLALGDPVSWSDTRSYDVQASKSPLSARFWAGRKPPGFPLVLKVIGSHEAVVVFHVAVAIVAWAVLAWVVASFVRGAWPRLLALCLVLGFALTNQIAIWDRVMLSESLALSTFALLVAALIGFVHRPGWLLAGAVAVSAGAWMSMRDTNIYVVLGAGAVLLIAGLLALARRRVLAARIVVAAVALIVLGGAALAVSASTVRGWDPLRHVLSDRILPYPDRLSWWEDHGMPQAAALRRLAVERTDTGAPAVGPAARDRRFGRYSRWVRDEGARTYVVWLATHPSYTLFEPFERPERVHLRRTVGEYSPDANELPLVSRLYFPPWPVSLGLLAVVLLLGRWLRRPRDATWWVAAGLVVLAVPHLLIAWHGDAASPIRHGLLGNVQAQLGILLLALVLLPRAAGGSRAELEDPDRVLVQELRPDVVAEGDAR
jgi:hypothetical protein